MIRDFELVLDDDELVSTEIPREEVDREVADARFATNQLELEPDGVAQHFNLLGEPRCEFGGFMSPHVSGVQTFEIA